MKEKRPLVGTADCGQDAPAAAALLARHRALHDDIKAYAHELHALHAAATRLRGAGITTLQVGMAHAAGGCGTRCRSVWHMLQVGVAHAAGGCDTRNWV